MAHFFANSGWLDYIVLRPLDHIRFGWELTWDPSTNTYREESGSFAKLVNELIVQLATTVPPKRYHDNEDRLAEFVRTRLNWNIQKVGKRWIGNYESILEQGGFDDADQVELLLAAAGRIQAARDHGQVHFDDMEKSHQEMLGAVLSIILYHRQSDEESDIDPVSG